MRKLLLSLFTVGLIASLSAQQAKVDVPNNLKNYAVKKSAKVQKEYTPTTTAEPIVSARSFSNTEIGLTEYDLQTNASVDTRIYLYSDNTIGATFTMGSGNFGNRGTGYNYFNGTAWGAKPTERVEPMRTGWGSYYPFNNGEIIVSHDGIANLIMSSRDTKGTGAWTQKTIAPPAGSGLELIWPRVITVGDTIHVLSASPDITYQQVETPIIYSRSVDAGTTWTHEILPGMDFASGQLSYSADMYAWATPKNGAIAFIVGGKWCDVFVMKSTDGGLTWTKTVVFEHPSPFTFDTGIAMDTTYVCDNSVSLEIDDNGLIHAAFGVSRVLVDDPSSEMYSHFPFVSYVAYWNENDGQILDLDIDVMYNQDRAVAFLLDLDEDGTLFANFSSFDEVKTIGGMVSQPQITLDGNAIYITFSHVNETLHSGSAYYSHIWARKSLDGGTTWSNFTEITGGLLNDYSECIFGAMAKNTDNYIHMIYQMDFEPGVFLRDDHSKVENDIIYIRVLKSDIGTPGANIAEYNTINSVSVFPNPANNVVNIGILSPVNTQATISITNLLGQTVYSQNIDVNNGNTIHSVNVNNFSSGIYVVSTVSGSYRNAQKLIVQ